MTFLGDWNFPNKVCSTHLTRMTAQLFRFLEMKHGQYQLAEQNNYNMHS